MKLKLFGFLLLGLEFSLCINHFSLAQSSDTCPTAEITSQNPGAVCEMAPVSLQAKVIDQVQYQWLKDGVAIVDATQYTLQVSSAGNYQVIFSTATCTDTSAVLTIVESMDDQPNTPVINGPSEVCEGSSIQLSTEAVSGATYHWSGPNGFSSTEQNPFIDEATLNHEGEYFLEVWLNACHSAQSSFQININPKSHLTISPSDTTYICSSDSIWLSVSGVSENETFQWYRNGLPIDNANNNFYWAHQAGAYFLQSTAESQCQFYSDTLIVLQPQLNVAYTVIDRVCQDEIVLFENQTDFSTTSDVSISWDFGDGTISTENAPHHTFTQPGTYPTRLTVNHQESGCSWFLEKEVEVIGLPEIELQVLGDTVFCQDDSVVLTVSGVFHQIQWSTGTNDTSLTAYKGGEYEVIAYNELGCSVQKSVSLHQASPLELEIVAEKTTLSIGESTTLQAVGANQVIWKLNGEIIGGEILLEITPDTTSTYTLIGYSMNGCEDSTNITIAVEELLPSSVDLKPMKLFSPNGDGIDDLWTIRGIPASVASDLRIFNIQGQLIYKNNDYFQEWSGMDLRGKEVPEGVYYYTLQLTHPEKIVSGSITLLR